MGQSELDGSNSGGLYGVPKSDYERNVGKYGKHTWEDKPVMSGYRIY